MNEYVNHCPNGKMLRAVNLILAKQNNLNVKVNLYRTPINVINIHTK